MATRSKRPVVGLGLTLLGVAAGVLGVLALLANPALAHSYLRDSDPADGAVLAKAPARVTLTFSDGVRSTGLGVTASGPDGQIALQATATDRRVVAQWPTDTGSGRYSVSYRVVSVDGHVMSGKIAFQIDLAEAEASESGTDTGTSSGSGTGSGSPDESNAAPTSPAETSSEAAITESDNASAQQAPGSLPIWLPVAAGLIAIVGVAAFVILRRRENS